MKNLLLFLLSLQLYADITLPSHTQQLIVVSAHDFNSTQANLQAYEKTHGTWTKVFNTIPVNLGRSGLAWGKGLSELAHKKDEPIKKEGDGKSPAGLFSLENFFGYEPHNFNFPYLQVNSSSLCIDDSSTADYNNIIQTVDIDAYKSFEYMKRKDHLYKLGIVVGHNRQGLKDAGSCIFLHIQKSHNSSTSGCTAMKEEKLLQLMQWLDKSKEPLLLQVPHSYLEQGFK